MRTTCSMLPNHRSLLINKSPNHICSAFNGKLDMLMNNVNHVFCLFVFSFPFFFKYLTPPPQNNYMLAMLYKALTISMIQLELAVVFLLPQSMYLLTIWFMYVPYLLFNYALYIFVHICL